MYVETESTHNLKQNETQRARAESTLKGVNQRSKDVTQTQQQRPESPTVILTSDAPLVEFMYLHAYQVR